MMIRRWKLLAGSMAAIIGLSTATFLLWNDPDTLRIHVEVTRDDDGHFTKRWTFSAGRRWESYGKYVRDGEHVVVLDPPGVRDGEAVRFIKGVLGRGADRITYEIKVDGLVKNGGDVTLMRTMVGNAGGTPAFSSQSVYRPSADGSPAREFIILTEDTAIRVPARVQLGVFGGTAEVIEFH